MKEIYTPIPREQIRKARQANLAEYLLSVGEPPERSGAIAASDNGEVCLLRAEIRSGLPEGDIVPEPSAWYISLGGVLFQFTHASDCFFKIKLRVVAVVSGFCGGGCFFGGSFLLQVESSDGCSDRRTTSQDTAYGYTRRIHTGRTNRSCCRCESCGLRASR